MNAVTLPFLGALGSLECLGDGEPRFATRLAIEASTIAVLAQR